jgi:PAS domain S-box-containing protein
MDKKDLSGKKIISELTEIRQRLSDVEQSLETTSMDTIACKNPTTENPTASFKIKDGVIKSINKQMREVTGYSEQELIGISPLIFLVPEDRNPLEKYIAKTNSKGSPTVFEFRVLTKNLKTKWVIAQVSSVSGNGTKEAIANLIDITEHKRTEESEKATWERSKDFCENINDMILCLATGGNIIFANRDCRNLIGYGEEDISRLSIFELFPEEYREHYREVMQRAISGEQITGYSTVLLDKNGKRTPVEGNMNCRFVEGKPDYVRLLLHDMTKRKKEQANAEASLLKAQELNKKLKQSNQELEDFAHIASHDLQEPLRKINSFGELLKESLNDRLKDDESENFAYMIDGAKRMQIMINDLLVYSRITTQRKRSQAVDPNQVINDLKKLELANILDETKGHLLIPQPLLLVNGDPSQVYQLFQNLITNGFKFCRQDVKPTVTVRSTSVPNKKTKFYVQDNGIGIEPEYNEQVFTMFKRLHSREQYSGTGIGLAICKKIVLRHGGEIGVESQIGEGSTFWFVLPNFSDQPIGDKGVESDDS